MERLHFVLLALGLGIIFVAQGCGSSSSNPSPTSNFSLDGYQPIGRSVAANDLSFSQQQAAFAIFYDGNGNSAVGSSSNNVDTSSPSASIHDTNWSAVQSCNSGEVDLSGSRDIERTASNTQLVASGDANIQLAVKNCATGRGTANGNLTDAVQVYLDLLKQPDGSADGPFKLATDANGNLSVVTADSTTHSIALKDFGVGVDTTFTALLGAFADPAKLSQIYQCKGTMTIDGKDYSCGSILMLKLNKDGFINDPSANTTTNP